METSVIAILRSLRFIPTGASETRQQTPRFMVRVRTQPNHRALGKTFEGFLFGFRKATLMAVHKVSFPALDWRGFWPPKRGLGGGLQRLVCELDTSSPEQCASPSRK
jgi:hypothetical protein